ncbi:MAG TPA: thioesterase domain-containing protein, partial [Candidatus Eisenbacteria bacterium]|nr:thioesterase domain-containing protein [Candidatus Eisenbacteria bacterium]
MTGRWLARLRPVPGAGSRIVCVPRAGSGPAALRPLVGALPATADVVGIRLPGRESRVHEPPLTSMEALVPLLLGALEEEAGPPFALVGDCSGALVAFELARAIHRASLPGLRAVVVVAHPPPDAAGECGPRAAMDPIERTRSLGGPGLEVLDDGQMAAIARRTLVADYAMFDGYVYSAGPPLEVPIVAVAGRQDRSTTIEAMAGWSRHTTADFTLHVIAGEHFLVTT